jgi:G3E family GTPase
MKKRGKFDYILLETTGLADPSKFGSVVVCHTNLQN